MPTITGGDTITDTTSDANNGYNYRMAECCAVCVFFGAFVPPDTPSMFRTCFLFGIDVCSAGVCNRYRLYAGDDMDEKQKCAMQKKRVALINYIQELHGSNEWLNEQLSKAGIKQQGDLCQQ